MTTVTKVKLAFAIMGLIIFAAGVRLDDARLRGIAIGFVFVAWVLRFVRPRPPAVLEPPGEGGERRGD